MFVDFLDKSTPAALKAYEALISEMIAKDHGLELGLAGIAEPEVALAALPIWQRTSTTKAIMSESPTGSAIMPKCALADAEIPRLPNYLKSLNALEAAVGIGPEWYVRTLLCDISFQHHQSTNGRFNAALQRYERWGVRSVKGWMTPEATGYKSFKISESTFHRIKDRLIAMGLILAEQHMWDGTKHLWIKPTETLCRILFEAGYMEQAFPKSVSDIKPAPAPVKRPRGNSARLAKIEAEHKALYRQACQGKCDAETDKKRWEVFHLLTKPFVLSASYEKAAFAPKGSSRYRRLYDALNLHFSGV